MVWRKRAKATVKNSSKGPVLHMLHKVVAQRFSASPAPVNVFSVFWLLSTQHGYTGYTRQIRSP